MGEDRSVPVEHSKEFGVPKHKGVLVSEGQGGNVEASTDATNDEKAGMEQSVGLSVPTEHVGASSEPQGGNVVASTAT